MQSFRGALSGLFNHFFKTSANLLVNFGVLPLELPEDERDVQKATAFGQGVDQIFLDLSVLVRSAVALDLTVISRKLGVGIVQSYLTVVQYLMRTRVLFLQQFVVKLAVQEGFEHSVLAVEDVGERP